MLMDDEMELDFFYTLFTMGLSLVFYGVCYLKVLELFEVYLEFYSIYLFFLVYLELFEVSLFGLACFYVCFEDGLWKKFRNKIHCMINLHNRPAL